MKKNTAILRKRISLSIFQAPWDYFQLISSHGSSGKVYVRICLFCCFYEMWDEDFLFFWHAHVCDMYYYLNFYRAIKIHEIKKTENVEYTIGRYLNFRQSDNIVYFRFIMKLMKDSSFTENLLLGLLRPYRQQNIKTKNTNKIHNQILKFHWLPFLGFNLERFLFFSLLWGVRAQMFWFIFDTCSLFLIETGIFSYFSIYRISQRGFHDISQGSFACQ